MSQCSKAWSVKHRLDFMNKLKSGYGDKDKSDIFDQYLIGALAAYVNPDEWDRAISVADRLIIASQDAT